MTEPLLTNDRAKREWEWIVRQVGEATAVAAMNALNRQKPYPLNIARKLKLKLPANLAEDPPASAATAKAHIAALRERLGLPKP